MKDKEYDKLISKIKKQREELKSKNNPYYDIEKKITEQLTEDLAKAIDKEILKELMRKGYEG